MAQRTVEMIVTVVMLWNGEWRNDERMSTGHAAGRLVYDDNNGHNICVNVEGVMNLCWADTVGGS